MDYLEIHKNMLWNQTAKIIHQLLLVISYLENINVI